MTHSPKTTAIATLLFATAMLTGCNRNSYTIRGTVEGDQFNGLKAYLAQVTEVETQAGYIQYSTTAEDSATIEDGAFTFAGKVDEAALYEVWTSPLPDEEGSSLLIPLVLEPGNIGLRITWHDSTDYRGGTPLNDALQACKERELQLGKDDPLEDQDIEHHITALWELYRGNRDNILGKYALINLSFYDDQIMYSKLFVDSLLAEASGPAAVLLERMSRMFDVREAFEKEMAEKAALTSAGKPYVDVPGIVKTLQGGEWHEQAGSLRDLIGGHTAVVDFWASWCGPCREEIKETLLGLHSRYKDDGLVVVGLDVRDDTARHAAAVADLGITYPQLIDTTTFSMDTYAIIGIPTIFLIDADGTIIGRDLRGDSLRNAVEKAMKRKQ